MMETTIEEKNKKEPVLWYVLRAIFGKELEIKKNKKTKSLGSNP